VVTDIKDGARRVRDAAEPVAAWVLRAPQAPVADSSYPQRTAGVWNVGGGPQAGPGLTVDPAAARYGAREDEGVRC
jgi:hypothetical protein